MWGRLGRVIVCGMETINRNPILDRSRTVLFVLLVGLASLVGAGVAGAQTLDPPEAASAQVEMALLALTPLVTLVSSFVLGPSASKAIKKSLPAIVGVVGSLVYFGVDTFPETTSGLVANILVVVAVAQKLYDPLDGFAQILLGGKRLNEATGPGIIGSTIIEGD